jgi:hypothetical protein
MKETWGTTSLVTDYRPDPKKKVLQEIVNNDLMEQHVTTETELYAPVESDSWEYGIEPKQVICPYKYIIESLI